VIYLDDILIFSENSAKHIETVREILEKLKENKLFVNLKKYDFGTNTIEFLGFIVGPNRTEIDPLRVQAIKD
jgi:Reverse transcriptase (RNA-dependent DNA polymerase)